MTGRKDIYQQAMSQGHSAAWDQMWERAAKFYQTALDEFPEDPTALISSGLALFELQDYPAALNAYRAAARVNPEDPIPVEKIAQISEKMGDLAQATEAALQAAGLYLKKGDLSKAIENWSRVTRHDPAHVMARSRLAQAHERLGRKPQAVTEYLALASLLQHSGKRRDAIQVVRHALQLVPSSQESRQALMMLENDQPLPKPTHPRPTFDSFEAPGVPQLAPAQGEQADDSQDPITEAKKRALAELARLLFELSDDQGANQTARRGLQELTEGLSLSGDRADRDSLIYHLRQAIDYQTQERYDQALEAFEQVLESGLDLPPVHYNLGVLHVQANSLDVATPHLQRAISQSDFALGGRLLLGDAFRRRGRMKQAALEYLEALKIADSRVVAPEQAGQLRQLYEPLIEAYALEANEEDHEQLCGNIAELLVHKNWRDQLEEARRELPVPDPAFPPPPLAEIITQARSSQIVGALASIHQHARSGHLRLAMEEAFRALDYAPTYLPLHALMGDLLIQQDQIEGAIEKFVVVAKAYSARGESARSIDLFRRTVQLDPMDLDGRRRLIQHLTLGGEIEEALKEYAGLAEVHFRLAELNKAREVYVESLKLAQQSHVDMSWRAEILRNIADIDMQRLDWRRALGVYEQLRELNPGDHKARASFIDLHLRMGQAAQALAELDSYITYLQKQGQHDLILGVLEELVGNHPANTGLRQRLARLYQSLGRVGDAVEQWDRVGDSMLDAGDREGAILAIQAIIALNPPNVADYQQVLQDLMS
jgi:tetratricopeptide (TPR) repeat protein